VLAGTGTNYTAHSIELTRRAIAAGADGVLVTAPYYNNPPREGLLRHFTAIAEAAGDTPVMLYNIPARWVIALEPDLVAQRARVSNIVAIKQAKPDLPDLHAIRSLAPDLAVYAGDDVSLLSFLPEGVVGVVSVASHLVGAQMKQVIELWQSGNEADARELSERLEDVYETLGITTNPIPVKAALQLLGFDVGAPRLPLIEASGMQRERIRAMLERHELSALHV
jgi:4-hydroxy-tetrahydrodipicolinate synthase